MIILFLLKICWGYITYDESTFRSFHLVNKGFLCFNNYSRTQTIKFRDFFQQIPKVILIPELFDIPTPTVDYNLEIISITERNFTLKIKCTQGVVTGIHYKWLAIDDARIQVINQFNTIIFNEQTFNHDNGNAQKYFISIISLSYIGPVNFEVKVSSITESKVVVEITDPAQQLSNLLSLGYQIVLGTDDMLKQFDIKQTSASATYEGEKYSLIYQSWFLIPFSAFFTNPNEKLRFKKLYNSDLNFQWYQIKAIDCCCQIEEKHQPQFLSYISNFQLTPLEFGSVQIKQIIGSKTTFVNLFKVQIQGKIEFIENLGESKILIDKNLQLIILSIHSKCDQNEVQLIEFYYGQIPNINTNYFMHQCNEVIREIYYSISFVPTSIAYQELIVSIQNDKCEVFQVLYNQFLTKVKLVEIKKIVV